MNNKPTQKSVDCPTCLKQVAWIEKNKFRPFCSKRCKLIDFGEWASERNAIPGDINYPVAEDLQDQ
ncbi:MAG: DNA gyrase inhibitor YacG [SAR86 cluster bacterium]|uniref:DNA gyrase inhibitor YacG n=1 Tax=SAR86 cluster bacterium TaxID=2030880 RepID=A0A2A5AYS9_9GAMM|nr:MAG: DNA gyrase inhibitor YacG [SAR86 cluster bacterium]